MKPARDIWLGMLLGVFVGDIPVDIHADPLGADWRLSMPVHLASNMTYRSDGHDDMTLQSVAAQAALRLSSADRPWSGGVFAERHLSDDRRIDGLLSVGGYLKRDYGDWDAALIVAHSKAPQGRGNWLYGIGLSREIADGHELAVRGIAAVDSLRTAIVEFSWEAPLGERLSLEFAAGAAVDDLRRRAVTAAFVWEVH